MRRHLVVAVFAFPGFSCGNDTQQPRSAAVVASSPSVERLDAGPPTDATPAAAAAGDSQPETPAEDSPSVKECKARLRQLGLEHGLDACYPKPPAPPLSDEVQQLPKKCAAESPRDKPCKTAGGVYKVRLELDPGEAAPCFGKKPVETTVRLKANTTYGDRRVLTWELGALLRALNLRDKAPSLGSDVRDGVCCIDIDVSEEAKGKFRRLVLHLASGETVVTAEASIGCDDSGDRTPLKVQVTR